MDLEAVLNRYQNAKTTAFQWHNIYEDVYDYTQPERSSYRRDAEGNIRSTHLYDSTGELATNAFTAKLQSTLTPPFQHWQKFQAGREIPEAQRDNVNRQLEMITKIFFDYLNASNFTVAVNEAYFDLAVGTGALYVRSTENKPLVFMSVPISKLYIEESAEGLIETVFLDRDQMPARDIKELWPKGSMSDQLTSAYKSNPEHKVNVIEATIYLPEEKKYRYMVIEGESKHIILDSMSPSSPWVVFRWMKRPGQIFGVGPALFARANIKSLNVMAEDELRAAAMKAGPMWLAWSDGVFNPYNFTPEPNTVIVGGGMPGAAPPLTPVPTGGDVQFTQLVISDLREQVLKAMYADILRPVDAPPQTATETLYKKQVLLEQIGPAMGRLQVEFLPRLTKRIVYLLQAQGLIPDFQVDGKEVDLVYTSPLAQAQNNSELEAYQQYIELLNATGGPQFTMNTIHQEKLASWVAEKVGLPSEIIKSDAEIAQDMQNAMQMAAALQAEQAPGVEGVPLPGQQQ